MKELRKLLFFLKPHLIKFSLGALFLLFFSLTRGLILGMLSPLLRVLFGVESPLNIRGGFIQKKIFLFLESHYLNLSPLQATFNLSLTIVLLFLASSIFFYVGKVLMIGVEERMLKDLRDRIFKNIIEMPYHFFHKVKSGEIVSKFINDVGLIKGALRDGIYVILWEGTTAFVYIGVAFLACWKLSLLSLILVPLATFFIFFIGKHLRRKSRKTQERMASLGQHLTEKIGGMKVVKGFGAEEREYQNFKKKILSYYKAKLRLEYLSALGSPLTELLSSIVAASILLYGANLIFIEKSLSPDRFFVFLAAALSLMQPLKRISMANAPLQQGIAALRRLKDLLEEKKFEKRKKEFKGFRSSIEFKEVSFSYSDERPALHNVSFEIRKGERVALVGPSGSGKTTIADLIIGLYTPRKGRILIDGADLSSYDLSSFRKKVAVVPQDPVLFSGTLLENIRYANPDASLDEVLQAAKKASVLGLIEKLPSGIETMVGERGISLSGGERQKVALARAFLRNPQILVLDEPTSSMDSKSEEEIREALKLLPKETTVIIIAHRLSTVREADKIIVLELGRIVDIGKHEELLKRCQLYRNLCELQLPVREDERQIHPI